MKVNGMKLVKKTVKEFKSGQTEPHMMVNGKMEWRMERVV